MTDEELSHASYWLYDVMDRLTDLTRSMQGTASYVRIEAPDAVNKLLAIESSIHQIIHRVQIMEKDGGE